MLLDHLRHIQGGLRQTIILYELLPQSIAFSKFWNFGVNIPERGVNGAEK